MEKAIRSLSKVNNDFALTLFKCLASEEGNIFFSPFSISTALAMLFNGARGDTAKEMRHVLGYDTANLSDDQVHKGFDNLLTTMRDNPDVYCLAIANAVLTQKDFPFLSQYKEDLEKIYRAVAREVDFVKEGPNVVAEINQWVKETTRNMIPKMLDSLDPSTIMVLLNAVYFKGKWEIPFNPKCTTSKPFYNNGLQERVKEVPMMYMAKYLAFYENDTFKALELPYQGENIVMLLLLPHARNGIKELEQNLKLDQLNGVKRKLSVTDVEVTLPKFHLEYAREMKETLQELGMKRAFSDEANLRDLSDANRLFVSQVLHKAVVEVNEEGTQAAAATSVVVDLCGWLVDPIFTADHPFVFLIFDRRSDLFLFMGRVEEL